MNFKPLLEKVKKDSQVLAVAQFGSSLTRKGRDIDICIFVKKGMSILAMSKLRLKYSSLFDYDIHIFQQLPLYIRDRIMKEGKILYGGNRGEMYSLYFETMKSYSFYRKLYDMYLAEIDG